MTKPTTSTKSAELLPTGCLGCGYASEGTYLKGGFCNECIKKTDAPAPDESGFDVELLLHRFDLRDGQPHEAIERDETLEWQPCDLEYVIRTVYAQGRSEIVAELQTFIDGITSDSGVVTRAVIRGHLTAIESQLEHSCERKAGGSKDGKA